MNQFVVRTAAIAIFLYLGVGPGLDTVAANTTSATMVVSLHVLPNCTVSADPIAFGTMTVSEAPDREASSALAVACSTSTPFQVSMDDGLYSADGARRAFDPATDQYVAYDIYTDAEHTTRLGDDGQSVSGNSDSGLSHFVAYGQITPTNEPSAGVYRDIITVSVTF